MSEVLNKHRQVWQEKKLLRNIYTAWYKMILKDIKPSPNKTVELGAGSGNFKEFMPNVISADIDHCDWLDMCFDAHQMPFENNTLANIVMIDVLHHLANPVKFLNEAYRTLEKGGRIIMLEPYPSPFSLFIYRKFHPEPFIMEVDYFNKQEIENKDPWDANQAIPYLLFFKHINQFEQQFQGKLKIQKKSLLTYILYPASGGFENKSIIPNFMIPLFKLLEILLTPFKKLLAFRCYVVIEKL